MQVMQLGNGGGFNFDQTSSSFLIKHEETLILVDCGFNVINKLNAMKTEDTVDYLRGINAVCITHMHEDHIANLMSLVYYRFFMMGKTTSIMAGTEEIRNSLRGYLKPCNQQLRSGQVVPTEMFHINQPHQIDNINIAATSAYHPGISATGFIFYTRDTPKTIVISGDTKATFHLEEDVTVHAAIHNKGSFEHIKVFHDFSNWDNVSQNVHACASDIASEYSDKFKEILTYYHDAKPFTRQWL